MPASSFLRPWHWIVITAALLILMAVGVTTYWKHQADRARDELRQALAALPGMNRHALRAAWSPKIDWTPAPTAPETLAVLPRKPSMQFDAIYVLYRGDRVAATLALTSIGGYFDGAPLDLRRHPDTLIGRPLNPAERADLDRLIGLLEQRLTGLDPQTDRYSWTREVLNIARDLARRQAARPPVVTLPSPVTKK